MGVESNCITGGCDQVVGKRGAQGRCHKCYEAYRHENPGRYGCIVEGCLRARVSKGLCSTHNTRRIKSQPMKCAERTCASCSEVFLPLRDYQIWCSSRCGSRESARRRLGIEARPASKVCWWCDKPFVAADGRKLYCGRECSLIGSKLDGRMAKYGLSRDQYRQLYRAQRGLCAICAKPERTARNRLLCVDHDHVTGHIKGLLCSHCNRGLGLFGDSARDLRRAADYVDRTRQAHLFVA